MSSDSVFRGWQLFCVVLVTFPPSKNLEAYVGSFIQERITTNRDDPGRIDIMAKYCLGRLAAIAKRGPRGKAPTYAEIETASVNHSCNDTIVDHVLTSPYRTQRSILPHLAHRSTLSINCSNVHIQTLKSRLYCHSSPMESSPLEGCRLKASGAFLVTTTPCPN